MRPLARTCAESWSAFVEFCYPTTCCACDSPAGADHMLCDGCGIGHDRLVSRPRCERCCMPLGVGTVAEACPYCASKGVYPFERMLHLGTFDEPLSTLIHRMKYNRRWSVGERLADELLTREDARLVLSMADCLVPVPLHARRQISRGYNQADVIARHLCFRFRAKKLRVERPLVRLRHTQTQTLLRSREKREENLKDAFGLIDADCVAGKHVVLIDDVMTTGATLGAAARAIIPAKPASLCTIVVAVADPKGRAFEVL